MYHQRVIYIDKQRQFFFSSQVNDVNSFQFSCCTNVFFKFRTGTDAFVIHRLWGEWSVTMTTVNDLRIHLARDARRIFLGLACEDRRLFQQLKNEEEEAEDSEGKRDTMTVCFLPFLGRQWLDNAALSDLVLMSSNIL